MTAPRQPSRLSADDGTAVRAHGDLYIFKVRAAQTEGHYSLFEARNVPGSGVPPHFHTLDEETFYVLEGTYEFQVGDQTIKARSGDCIHVPRPTPHAFWNVGAEAGRLLVVISPGGYHEAYFEEAWEPIADVRNLPPSSDEPPDMAKVGAALARAGMEMVGSPGS